MQQLAESRHVLAKVVYHKLADPDHKKLRTLVVDGQLQHVNNGYCTLLEPKQVWGSQFAEWIRGRNPGTYVAVHYIKLIDFTFGWTLASVTATGQRGLVGAADVRPWDSVNAGRLSLPGRSGGGLRHPHQLGHARQLPRLRGTGGAVPIRQRRLERPQSRRGVECTIEGKTPVDMKISLNNHYSSVFIEPDGRRTQRGYGIEVLERFMREVAYVEYGGDAAGRPRRLAEMRQLLYNDLSADRQVVAAVQALEAVLKRHRTGEPDCVAHSERSSRWPGHLPART